MVGIWFLDALAREVDGRWFGFKTVDGFVDEWGEGVDEKGDKCNEDDEQEDHTLPRPIGFGSVVNFGILRFPFVVHSFSIISCVCFR